MSRFPVVLIQPMLLLRVMEVVSAWIILSGVHVILSTLHIHLLGRCGHSEVCVSDRGPGIDKIKSLICVQVYYLSHFIFSFNS